MDNYIVPMLGVVVTLLVFQLGLMFRSAIVTAVLAEQVRVLAIAVDRLTRVRSV